MDPPYNKPGERWSFQPQVGSNQPDPLRLSTLSQTPVTRQVHVPVQAQTPGRTTSVAHWHGLPTSSPIWGSAPPPAHLMPIQFAVPPGETPRFFDPTNPPEPHNAMVSRAGVQPSWVVSTPDGADTQKQQMHTERLSQTEELELLRTCLRYKEMYRTVGTQGKWWAAVAADLNLYRLKTDGGGEIQAQTIKRRVEVAMTRRKADKDDDRADNGTPEYLELLDTFMAYVQQLGRHETATARTYSLTYSLTSAQLDEILGRIQNEHLRIEAEKKKEKLAPLSTALDVLPRQEKPSSPQSSQRSPPSQQSQQFQRSQSPAMPPSQSRLQLQVRPRSPAHVAPGSRPHMPIVITDSLISWPRADPPPSTLPNLSSKQPTAPVLHPYRLAPEPFTQSATQSVVTSQPGMLNRLRESSVPSQSGIDESLPKKRQRVDNQIDLAQNSQLQSVVERWGPTMEAIQGLATELSDWRKEERQKHNRPTPYINDSCETDRLQSSVDELHRQLTRERVVNDRLAESLAEVRASMDATKAELRDLSNKFIDLQKQNEARDKRATILFEYLMKKK